MHFEAFCSPQIHIKPKLNKRYKILGGAKLILIAGAGRVK